MNKPELIETAREFRRKGFTYKEINSQLKTKIPKNTLSYWCRNVILPSWYKNKIKKINRENLVKLRIIALKTNKIKRDKFLLSLKEKNIPLIKKINITQEKLLLSILYLGEGAKHSRSSTLTLGSSNPLIIKLYLKLLKDCFLVDKSKFRARIQCRFDQNIKELEDHWMKTTNIDKKLFYPTYIDKRTKGKPTLKKDYKGVCVIHYFDRKIQLELEFLANAIIEKLI